MSENVALVLHKPFQATGITSTISTFRACFGITGGAAVKIYPTSAGSANVYSSTSPMADCQADIVANNFLTGKAVWDQWGPGLVTAKTNTTALIPSTCAVCIPSTGIWTMEVVQ